jgi:site-specific DNA-methyltransferase (adenine-specific)
MGEAARFFYTPKACKDDRDDGCEMMQEKQYSHDGRENRNETAYQRNDSKAHNFHPTVKPTDLMRYLCRMVTPTGGVVLDPFTGSGSTGRGAVLEGFRFIGCEMDADYIEIAKARILAAEKAYQPCLTFD